MGIEEIVDRLYALPVGEFTQARTEAERELRRAGAREQADQVRTLRKPTAAAGAVNRLVRTHRPRVEAFLRAAAALRDAQVAGKGDVASAARAEREALEQLVALGGEAVRPTLQAAAVDDDTARRLLEAQLVREPEPRGFGTLLAHAEPTAGKPATAEPRTPKRTAGGPAAAKSTVGPASATRPAAKPSKPDDRAARARLREAKHALTEAAAKEGQARRNWTQSQRELEQARAAVERAQRDLDRLRAR